MIEERYEELINELKKYDKLAVAFSGGVDSTLLLKAAKDALGDNVAAMTVKSVFVSKTELEDAEHIAREIDVKQVIIPFDTLSIPDIRKNPKDRCYHCKSALLVTLLEEAEKMGISCVAEGSNLDDTKDYRPGFKAVQEFGILSPLLSVKLTKKEIREILKTLNLPNWNKPAAACLASRIAYGDIITKEALDKVEQAETLLSSFGFVGSRVRLHKNVARIEILEKDFENFLASRERILYSLKSLEFPFIALDLEGYKRGNMNKAD